MRIVLAEYPKSGGSWIVSLIGDALGLPKRDIYMTNAYTTFDVGKHPWYRGASDFNVSERCVVKSHELPDSPLSQLSGRVIHLVRDGRDVVVSKYFFERDFCVANGIYAKFEERFEDYVPRVAGEWNRYVLAWLEAGVPYFKYEDFLRAPADSLRAVLEAVGAAAPAEVLRDAVESNTKEKFRAVLALPFAHNTFVRRGVAGDWRNHFQEPHAAAFR